MKILMLGAAMMLLMPAFVNAAPAVAFGVPRADISNLVSKTYEIQVPVGHALVFSSVDGISTAPLTALNTRGPPAGCLAAAGTFWVTSGIVDCGPYEIHNGELSEAILISANGAAFADALDYNAFSYWFVSCTGPAAISGVRGCTEFGSVAGMSNWDALTGATLGLSLYQ